MSDRRLAPCWGGLRWNERRARFLHILAGFSLARRRPLPRPLLQGVAEPGFGGSIVGRGNNSEGQAAEFTHKLGLDRGNLIIGKRRVYRG